jgi:mRNA interferase RelE/StbE
MKVVNYRIRFTDTALKSLKNLSVEIQIKVIKKIEELALNPIENRNVKKLVEFDVSFRLRIGDYRVLFERDDKLHIIDIIDIRHRNKSYKRK